MTRNDLVRFLEASYEPDEQLVWQVMTKEDLGCENDKIWAKFVDYCDNEGYFSDHLSRSINEEFDEIFPQWLNEQDPQEEEIP